MRYLLPQITPYLRVGLRWPEGLRAMRHRNFRLFFFGQLLSLSGTWMQTTAQQWLVYRLTGSQLSLGAVTFASFIPVLGLSLFMGVIIDRWPRRRILLGTQTWFMALALALALITYLGVVRYEHILALAVLLGVGNALDMPTRQAFFIDLAEREDLQNAIALNSSVFNGARIIGPALGGLVIARWGEAPAFALNGLSFLFVLAGLLWMRLPPSTRASATTSARRELQEAMRHVAADRRLLGLVSMTALFSLFAFPYIVLLPAFARDVLGIGADGFGALMSAQGAGALASALALAFWGKNQNKGRQLLLSRGWMALGIAGLGLSTSPLLSMAGLAVAGYALIAQLAVTNTLIQLVVPDALRGRVMSAYTWALGGFWPLGALLMGKLGDELGAPTTVLLSAAACLSLALVEAIVFPEVRHMK